MIIILHFLYLFNLKEKNVIQISFEVETMNKNMYAMMAAAAMAGCSPSLEKRAEVPAVKEVQEVSNCDSVNLAEKVGFNVQLNTGIENFCYGVRAEEGNLNEYFTPCDQNMMPVADQLIVLRTFEGVDKGSMELRYVVASHDDTFQYVPFWRSADGSVTTIFPNQVPENIEYVFQKGADVLNQAKALPEVCQELLKYQPQP